ncbi:tyrosine-type recombinase/integrase [Pseudoduganella sp. FT26W]|uniref:Tyrosine-type recombinase/integrase n=1 Tax=Duganella aquatilis TaxID=2666082 RepID=A0A844CZX6_9BURK|nr:integrase family protein [Duganella aquatilis]MRW86367.1 tyrosine-type recombinase/integrase [Duganella aquatilis]
MARVAFTAGRIDAHRCGPDKAQEFIWDTEAPGLGLRATRPEAGKPLPPTSFIFQAKLNGKTIRVTIGDRKAWSIDAARAEARRLKVMIDSGQDPRQVKADALAAEEARREAKLAEQAAAAAAALRDSITLGDAWPIYVAERTPHWGDHQISAHRKIMQAGGEKRKRSPKLTKAGPLSVLSGVRLVDLTDAKIEAWAKVEAAVRPSSARLAMRLLKAFMNWCAGHSVYAALVTVSAAKSSRAREILGKPKMKHDLLQREQLAAWFDEVRKIGNPVIAAYLQTLLMTGARREEVAKLRWADVDFQWASMRLGDKVEDFRMVPLTPYVAHLLAALPRRNEWVFSSPSAESGRLAEPRIAHNEAVAAAGLPHLTLHGLRRSFATLSEWVEMPAGIAAQIQGHAPQGVREQNYIRRPLDLLRKWHIKIEEWILEQAGVEFTPAVHGLRVVGAN